MTKNILLFNRHEKEWRFYSAANIRMRIRSMFAAKAGDDGPYVKLTHNESNCLDASWVLERYPHDMDPNHRQLLLNVVAAAREREKVTAEIMEGTFDAPQMDLAIPLRDYQMQAVALALSVGSLLVGDDLGLGKTLIGIGACAAPGRLPAVIVTLPHLQLQWLSEFKKFAPHIRAEIAKKAEPYPTRAEVLIMSYNKLQGWAGSFSPETIVFDEAHDLRRGGDSKKYVAAKVMCESADVKIQLTATPVFNYGGEIYALLDLIRPGCLGSEHEFCREWCEHNSKHWIVKDPQALGAYLREQTLMIRRVRADVGRSLPPMTVFAEQVPYNDKALAILKKDALQLARTLLNSKDFNAKGQAARQLDIKLRQGTGIAKAPFVADFVAELVAQGKKVMLAGWHREVYAIWEEKFKAQGVPYVMYTGEESPTQKQKAKDAFMSMEGGGVFVISLRSGAGLDGLQTVCDTVVVGELDWSPQVHIQLFGRLQRDGLFNREGVTVFYLVADAGSDPIIASILGVKLEQGHGITDPTVNIESLPVAQTLTGSELAKVETNRMAKLAADFIKRYAA